MKFPCKIRKKVIKSPHYVNEDYECNLQLTDKDNRGLGYEIDAIIE